jgi:hypothetical protein
MEKSAAALPQAGGRTDLTTKRTRQLTRLANEAPRAPSMSRRTARRSCSIGSVRTRTSLSSICPGEASAVDSLAVRPRDSINTRRHFKAYLLTRPARLGQQGHFFHARADGSAACLKLHWLLVSIRQPNRRPLHRCHPPFVRPSHEHRRCPHGCGPLRRLMCECDPARQYCRVSIAADDAVGPCTLWGFRHWQGIANSRTVLLQDHSGSTNQNEVIHLQSVHRCAVASIQSREPRFVGLVQLRSKRLIGLPGWRLRAEEHQRNRHHRFHTGPATCQVTRTREDSRLSRVSRRAPLV